MNLLELMLKEEFEWPVGVGFAVQLGNMSIGWFYSRPEFYSDWCGTYETPSSSFCCLCDDWSTRIITREEYQAAGGWMKWEGGECPVNGILVKYRMRNSPSLHSEGEAENLRWNHDRHGDGTESDGDITAYRIINQRPVQLDNPEIEPVLFYVNETEGV